MYFVLWNVYSKINISYLILLQETRFAATQGGTQCFCDNVYDLYGEAQNCNMPCSGNKTTMCGGDFANQVIKLGQYQ